MYGTINLIQVSTDGSVLIQLNIQNADTVYRFQLLDKYNRLAHLNMFNLLRDAFSNKLDVHIEYADNNNVISKVWLLA